MRDISFSTIDIDGLEGSTWSVSEKKSRALAETHSLQRKCFESQNFFVR